MATLDSQAAQRGDLSAASGRRVVIPDFGLGNLSSIVRMTERMGGYARIAEDPDGLAGAKKIILAGVGAFDHGMAALDSCHWRGALEKAVLERGIPVLGICLGMQMLCAVSEEGQRRGLGWIDAEVRRFRFPPAARLQVPHMGWNTLSVVRDNALIPFAGGEQRFYFAHSYRAVCNDGTDPVAMSDHGGRFVAAFERGNIYGVQFHPEKSHRFGMALFERFLNL